ncbi:uncharacterized protein EI90DRAFT_3030186 [Cantharellus anzutake]|uniref:uncharacterized protein n=1 Tax=Cantharellus anzutake TaxID=1750568 RepID=UPI0019037C35|nr:uncharacterized protein EI90DRAFT_3030186 [Cantharellus anzutake]KAF8342776.1 hypothetical protein EI90DRAFT_3030186 [Cantharellus anzutake]
MTNWESPAEVQKDTKVWACFVVALCGVATWDVLVTFWFDWQILSGKRNWKWPMALYFTARLCLLFHLWFLSINLNAVSEIPCQAFLYILKVADMIGTTSSSSILALRTYAIWHQDKRVGIPLALGTLGQLVAWCQTLRFSISRWDPVRKFCARLQTAPPAVMITTFSYTIGLDLCIVILAAWKLAPRAHGGGIGVVLLRDGIIYFIAVFLGNTLETVMVALDLSPVMNLMAVPFALTVSVIASTTVFRHVFMHCESSSHFGPSNGEGRKASSLQVKTPGGSGPYGLKRSQRSTTDTFALTDFKTAPNGMVEMPVIVTQTIDIERDPHKPTDTLDYDRRATRAQAVVTLGDNDMDDDSLASRNIL